MKIYSIIVTVFLIIAGVLVYSFYSQATMAKANLLSTQNQLEQSRGELNNFRQLVSTSLNNSKASSALLNDSLASFLVAGDLKIASLSNSAAQKISTDIQKVVDPQDKVALEQGWDDFLQTRKIADYLAFSRFLIQNIQNNLENIH